MDESEAWVMEDLEILGSEWAGLSQERGGLGPPAAPLSQERDSGPTGYKCRPSWGVVVLRADLRISPVSRQTLPRLLGKVGAVM